MRWLWESIKEREARLSNERWDNEMKRVAQDFLTFQALLGRLPPLCWVKSAIRDRDDGIEAFHDTGQGMIQVAIYTNSWSPECGGTFSRDQIGAHVLAMKDRERVPGLPLFDAHWDNRHPAWASIVSRN